MSEYISKLVDDIAISLNKGILTLDSTDGYPWHFYAKLNTVIGNKKTLLSSSLPVWRFVNDNKSQNLLEEYLKMARKFYLQYKEDYCLDDYNFDKKLLFDLVVNASNYNLNNFEPYLKEKTDMLTTNVKVGEIARGKIALASEEVDVSIKIMKNDSKLEGPYKFVTKFKNDEGEFNLPVVTFGIRDNVAYIYAVQNRGNNKDKSILAKKMDRYFRKFNKDIDVDSDEYLISPSFLASATIFIDYLEKNNIKDIEAPVFLPIRYLTKELALGRQEDEEKRNLEEEEILRDQFNMTNRFSYLMYRYKKHFDNTEIYFDDVKEVCRLVLHQDKKASNDNEIYNLKNSINRNVK